MDMYVYTYTVRHVHDTMYTYVQYGDSIGGYVYALAQYGLLWDTFMICGTVWTYFRTHLMYVCMHSLECMYTQYVYLYILYGHVHDMIYAHSYVLYGRLHKSGSVIPIQVSITLIFTHTLPTHQ